MGRWLKLVTMAALAALAIACGGGDDERPNTRAGRILSRTFLGSTVRYTALVDGQPWLIETGGPGGQRPARGRCARVRGAGAGASDRTDG